MRHPEHLVARGDAAAPAHDNADGGRNDCRRNVHRLPFVIPLAVAFPEEVCGSPL
jgi:hypothetical protein